MAERGTGRPVGRPRKVKPSNLTEGNFKEEDGTKIPEPPKSLGIDGLNIWKQVWMNSGKTLDAGLDYLLVENLCTTTDQIAYLRRALSLGKIGGGVDRSYTAPNGTKASDPYFNQMLALMKLQTSLMTEIGMTPAARAKMGQQETINSGTELVLNLQDFAEQIRNNAKAEK